MSRGWRPVPVLGIIGGVIMMIVASAPSAAATGGEPADSVAAHRAADAALLKHEQLVMNFGRVDARAAIPRMESPVQNFNRLLAAIDESREATIKVLDELAPIAPGSDLITGFRVGFRVESRRLDAAADIVADCRASPWWCSALRGLVFHASGDIVAADAAFAESIVRMAPTDRCDLFRELHYLTGRVAPNAATADDCAEVERDWARTWWLADPLHTSDGNDRLNEHMSRAVIMRLHHHLTELDGWPCTEGHHRSALQRGWPPWGTSQIPQRWEPAPWNDEGIGTVPAADTYLDPLWSDADAWTPTTTRIGERYRPTFGHLGALVQQTGFFRRGDSLLVVSSVEVPANVTSLALALSQSEQEPPRILPATLADGRSRPSAVQIEGRAPLGRWLVSVEARAPGAGGAHRARLGHGLPAAGDDGVAISDVVLTDRTVEDDDDPEPRLDRIRSRIRAGEVVDRSRPTGIFWEVYGGAEGDVLESSVTVRRDDRSLARRVGEFLRVVGARRPISLEWTTIRSDQEVQGVHLAIDFRNLEPGRYTLEVALVTAEGSPVVARRAMEVR